MRLRSRSIPEMKPPVRGRGSGDGRGNAVRGRENGLSGSGEREKGGMKGGNEVIVGPHRHSGVFIAKGKEDALVTKNLVPGVTPNYCPVRLPKVSP